MLPTAVLLVSVYIGDVLDVFASDISQSLLVLVPVRLGSESLNPIYIPCITVSPCMRREGLEVCRQKVPFLASFTSTVTSEVCLKVLTEVYCDVILGEEMVVFNSVFL